MSVGERIEVVDGVEMYRISNADEMDPFLMTIVSSSDLWMFISSAGGLSAGRVEPADCLFPYETDDRLHGARGQVGPVTVLRVRNHEGTILWEPFTGTNPHTRRNLFKSLRGDAIVFEEEHLDLGLAFRSRWAPSDRFGWVRTASLHNRDAGTRITIEAVDGLVGVMPWGIGVALQQQMSNLANAYRRSELIEPGIGIFTLEALIVDRPEPAEALRATTAWTTGLDRPQLSVDPLSLELARRGQPFQQSSLRTGRPGSFLLGATIEVEPGQSLTWHIVADVAQDHADIARLRAELASGHDMAAALEEDIGRSSSKLRDIVASSDGVHLTSSTKMDAHHFANTLFNVMRGGTFMDGYSVHADRFGSFLEERNRRVADRHAEWLAALPRSLDVQELRTRAAEPGDPNLVRLAYEYLPLSFSRRHGDPSRPWNHFSIRVRDEHDEPLMTYQGNWRDIFQNWEALCRSYPAFLPSMVAIFLNASTADGYNPYRITSEGVDWEVPEPDNPWSGIGYWGDHQIVYLHRLLESQEAHDPGWLTGELGRAIYTFADVPYRITSYDELVRNPKATVEFDEEADEAVAARVSSLGSDGKLVADAEGNIVHVSLLEKLLIPALAKLSNFVPRGGIWMNTERPEWNDANNALVGNGLSMVTLSYLRAYLRRLGDLTAGLTESWQVSADVVAWTQALIAIFESHSALIEADELAGENRARMLHELGGVYDAYRANLYAAGTSAPKPLEADTLQRLVGAALVHLDDAVRSARREDGLYDAYNILHLREGNSMAGVEHLPPMLEGQVAAISSGLLDTDEVSALIAKMYDSGLYRADVDSFLLYPARLRPGFVERNLIPAHSVESNPLLTALLEAGSRDVVVRAADGRHHFNPDFRRASDLEAALDRLDDVRLQPLVREFRAATLELYEEVFRHREFTGRSSSMYAYEGIGSVYWHMVAKLLVAVQECILAEADRAGPDSLAELLGWYARIRAGLGFNTSVSAYGAFPTDPYSHTPAHAGAQQPGMTGQVKEELLTRWAELGLTVSNGSIRFTPVLLDRRELRTEPGKMTYLDPAGTAVDMTITPGSLGFTVCQVPVVVHATDDGPHVVVTRADGTVQRVDGWVLAAETSQEIFRRTGRVQRLDVFVPESSMNTIGPAATPAGTQSHAG